MNLKKNYLILVLLALGAVAATLGMGRKDLAAEPPLAAEKSFAVKARQVADFASYEKDLSYQALVVGEREAIITAKAAGTVEETRAEVGMEVSSGALLARIDDSGALLGTDGSALGSSQIRQGEIALEEARKNYKDAKENYEDAAGDDRDAARLRRDIAKLQKESADISLKAAYDARLITAPISGTVLERFVSRGESVSAGTPLFKLGTSRNVRVRFFVEEKSLDAFAKGASLVARTSFGEEIPCIVKVRSQAAQIQSKRFLIEAVPQKPLKIGTVVEIKASLKENPSSADNILVPVSILTTTQNGSFLFVAEDGKAVKKEVKIIRVDGEMAEVKASLSPQDLIVTEGAKLLSEGTAVLLK